MAELKQFDFGAIKGEQIGTLVRASAYVSGESGQKAAYSTREATCLVCNQTTNVRIAVNPKLLYKLLAHEVFDVEIPKGQVKECTDGKHHRWELREIEPPLMFQEVYLRNSMDATEPLSRSTNRDYHAFVIGEVPESKDVTLEAIPFANAKTFDVEFLVNSVVPKAGNIDAFELMPEEVTALKAYCSGKTLSDFMSLAEKVNPRIAGHTDAKLAVLLTYVSPTWIWVNGQLRPATMRVLLFGDPRQGKGSIADYLRQKTMLGKHAIGETSSRTGITYTIDTERGIIVWGVMVEADRGLVVLEALHRFPPEDLATMRETLVKLYVEVRRSFSSKAWARTRVIADSNGRQELARYIYQCQAVRDLPMLLDQVDLTRWDYFIPFKSGEIEADDIATAQLEHTDDNEFLDNVRRLSLWAWSRKPEQVIFSVDAMKEARDGFKGLLKEYSLPEIPLVHEDSLLTVLRSAAAFAALSFSTTDGTSLEVKAPHVKLALEFMGQTLDALELLEYKASVGETVLTEEDLKGYYDFLDRSEVAAKIIEAISKGPRNSKDLEAITGHEASSIRHTCTELKAREIIDRNRQGYTLTKKGVLLYKQFHTTKTTDTTEKVRGGI